MKYEEVREMLLRQWKYTGGPNEAKTDIYHGDGVLEFPLSDEWLGKATFMAWRERYPAKLDFEPAGDQGQCGDLWIAEGVLRYDGANPVHFVLPVPR